eukprot:1007710-Rhodomonas_salina.2
MPRGGCLAAQRSALPGPPEENSTSPSFPTNHDFAVPDFVEHCDFVDHHYFENRENLEPAGSFAPSLAGTGDTWDNVPASRPFLVLRHARTRSTYPGTICMFLELGTIRPGTTGPYKIMVPSRDPSFPPRPLPGYGYYTTA